MKQIKIHTPKPQTTLPRHEQAARHARKKVLALPGVPRKRRHTAAPTPRAEFHSHPSALPYE